MFNVEHVLAGLTLEEKVGLTSGQNFWELKSIAHAGVPTIMVTDGPHGLRKQAGNADHLGLSNSVPATCFPPAVNLAATWDVDLITRVGEALGVECTANNVSVLLGPGVNIKRSPLCGRNFEYFSEDPLLAGDLSAAWINGVESQGVGTSLKHFAANNQEADRMGINAMVDDRALREIYLAAFERTIQNSKPGTIMCAYNGINGTMASQNHWLLTEVLRDEWGWDGVVVSDWGATYDRVGALKAGMDLEMPAAKGTDQQAIDAVAAGLLDEAIVDQSARRVLNMIAKYAPQTQQDGTFDRAAHHTLAAQAAAQSIVLLKNEPVGDAPLLPLSANSGKVAVIGEFARTPRYQGAGSSQVNPTELVSVLDGLKQRGHEVSFAPGFGIGHEPNSKETDRLSQEAINIARAAHTVVLCLGLPAHAESEGFDRSTLSIPQDQIDLINKIAAVTKRIVVVLFNGSVVEVSTWQDSVPALVETYLGGQAAGLGVADVLYGTVNPSGKLAETIPVRLEDTSSYGNFPGEFGKVHYNESIMVGYRHFDHKKIAVAYPFGHGLSYTSFSYGNASATVSGSGTDTLATVRVTVTNTGAVAGAEVVQAYVAELAPKAMRPVQELKGFAKVYLEPGESRQVTLELDSRSFAFWHPILKRWAIESGEFEIRVGASSRDIRVTSTVSVVGTDNILDLTLGTSIADALAHPGGELIAQQVLAPLQAMMGEGETAMSPQNMAMFAAMPLAVLPTLGMTPMSSGELSALLDRANQVAAPTA